MKNIKLFITGCYLLLQINCNSQRPTNHNSNSIKPIQIDPTTNIICGAERLETLLPMLQNKRIALLINQTSVVANTHLADTLLALKVDIKKIFAPEHGFRGEADAGDHVSNGIDIKTGVKIISLYGSKMKPSKDDLKDIDIVIFDIQDVGARFYTYIASLHYLMEACAENNKEVLVLDRPNPNGFYVDGPVLKKGYESFVGVDPIPVVHGLTVGEYAQMVNGEKWLLKGIQCKLNIISCLNYTHSMRYKLPIKPSPNMPNEIAVYNYPSICYFEGTDVSVGRGTDNQFQMIGAPQIMVRNFSFKPVSKPGAKSPPHLNQICFGYDLRRINTSKGEINLSYLLDCYKSFSDTSKFFLPTLFFDKLAGSDQLRKQIIAGNTEVEIKATWKEDLDAYKLKREKYLLYK